MARAAKPERPAAAAEDRHAGVGLKLPEGDQYLDAQQPIIAGKISHQCRYGQPRLGMQIAQHSHGCVVDAPVLIAQPGDQRGDDKIQIGALPGERYNCQLPGECVLIRERGEQWRETL